MYILYRTALFRCCCSRFASVDYSRNAFNRRWRLHGTAIPPWYRRRTRTGSHEFCFILSIFLFFIPIMTRSVIIVVLSWRHYYIETVVLISIGDGHATRSCSVVAVRETNSCPTASSRLWRWPCQSAEPVLCTVRLFLKQNSVVLFLCVKPSWYRFTGLTYVDT